MSGSDGVSPRGGGEILLETGPARAFEPPNLSGTLFADLSPEVATILLVGSRVVTRAARTLLFVGDDRAPRAGLLLSGTARSFLIAADGRQLTVRYSRRGALLGKGSHLSGDHSNVSVEAMTTCAVLELNVERLLDLVNSQVAVARAVAGELTGRLEDVYGTLADVVFGSVRQRLVRHLLALANPPEDGAETIIPVTQQQLADGIGTSREVVARELAALRREGLVRTGPRAIEVRDFEGLASFLGSWRTSAARRQGV
jgi:CRP/FNR family cyclic AMP-dependent transcriptional regulator